MTETISQQEFDAICASRTEDRNPRKSARMWVFSTMKLECAEWARTTFELPDEERTNFCDHLSTHHTFNRRFDMFWALGGCDCCVRHQGSLPVSMYNDDTTPPPPAGSVGGCECTCRHDRRFLRRSSNMNEI